MHALEIRNFTLAVTRREDGSFSITSTDLPGFRFNVEGDVDSIKVILATLQPALETYVTSLLKYEHKKKAEETSKVWRSWFSAIDFSHLRTDGKGTMSGELSAA